MAAGAAAFFALFQAAMMMRRRKRNSANNFGVSGETFEILNDEILGLNFIWKGRKKFFFKYYFFLDVEFRMSHSNSILSALFIFIFLIITTA